MYEIYFIPPRKFQTFFQKMFATNDIRMSHELQWSAEALLSVTYHTTTTFKGCGGGIRSFDFSSPQVTYADSVPPPHCFYYSAATSAAAVATSISVTSTFGCLAMPRPSTTAFAFFTSTFALGAVCSIAALKSLVLVLNLS